MQADENAIHVPEPVTAVLNREQSEEWVRLSDSTYHAGSQPSAADFDALRKARDINNGSWLGLIAGFWLAELSFRSGLTEEAVDGYRRTIAEADRTDSVEGVDPTTASMHHLARIFAATGDTVAATDMLTATWERNNNPNGLFEAGTILEASGQYEQAADLYGQVAAVELLADSADVTQVAARHLRRLEDPANQFFASVEELEHAVWKAVSSRQGGELVALASKTHFAAGPGAGHPAFDVDENTPELVASELSGKVSRRFEDLVGSGGRRYLMTTGWNGKIIKGEVVFVFTQSARGWQWSGLICAPGGDEWQLRWHTKVKQTNQPLPFSVTAPWADGMHMMAGGQGLFVRRQLGVIGAGLFAPLVARWHSRGPCGFGMRGFYYNSIFSHVDEDAFAIDFTRYGPGMPYSNSSDRIEARVVAPGLVADACGLFPTGNPDFSNTVEVLHQDPAGIFSNRFMSRYLHLAGPPSSVPLMAGMFVIGGERVGQIDDTGNSELNHLHFSIHDQARPFPGVGTPGTPASIRFGSVCTGTLVRGSSVRPQPMEGGFLGDEDSGRCIRSTNRRRIIARFNSSGRVIVRAPGP